MQNRYIKNWLVKNFTAGVYRLEIANFLRTFSHVGGGIFNPVLWSVLPCCPSPLLSGSTPPPTFLPKYTVYTYSECKEGQLWGSVREHILQEFYRLAQTAYHNLNFETFKEPKNRFQGTNSARLCSQACRYDNPMPTRFLAPIDCLKI